MDKSGGRKARARSKAEEQPFAVFKVGGDYGEVVFPLESEADFQTHRTELSERAVEFHRKGLFIRKITSQEFLNGLGADLARECRPEFEALLAARVAVAFLEEYADRLKQALAVDDWQSVLADRPFLAASGSSGKHFLFNPPPGFQQNILDRSRNLIRDLFDLENNKINFWGRFSEWIWINQMAQAMEDLEEAIGTATLERLPSDELLRRVIATYAESEELLEEFPRLANVYLQQLGDILASAPKLDSASLRQIEYLIGLVERPSDSRIVAVEMSSLLEQIGSALGAAKLLHSLSPRKFEELIAYGLEKSGFDKVQITPQTRDGGYDIEAFRNGPMKERILVECKRWAAERKVGRPTLDALLGVLHREKANQAVLATTSSFSKDALGLLRDEQWRLQGMDLDALLEFLRRIRTPT